MTGFFGDDFYACQYCGAWHTGICPRVKAIEYGPDGRIVRVEFHEPGCEPVEVTGTVTLQPPVNT